MGPGVVVLGVGSMQILAWPCEMFDWHMAGGAPRRIAEWGLR